MYINTNQRKFIKYPKRKPLRFITCPLCRKRLTKSDKSIGYCSCISDRYKISETTVDGMTVPIYKAFRHTDLRREFYHDVQEIKGNNR